MFSGLTANSKKNFQLDAGALYKGWVMGTDTPATASSKLIGATVGGATISIVPEVRQIQVDGVKTNAKGFEVFDGYTATLSATVKEITPAGIKVALGAASVTQPSEISGYTKILPKEDISDDDYIDNIAWVGRILGSSKPVVIILKNALSLNGWTLTVQDKNEGSVPVVFTAHYDPANLDDVPVEIYTPVIE